MHQKGKKTLGLGHFGKKGVTAGRVPSRVSMGQKRSGDLAMLKNFPPGKRIANPHEHNRHIKDLGATAKPLKFGAFGNGRV